MTRKAAHKRLCYFSGFQIIASFLLILVEKVETVFLVRFSGSRYLCSVIVILLNLVHQKYAVACIDKARLWRALFVSVLKDTALPLDGRLMNGLENLRD